MLNVFVPVTRPLWNPPGQICKLFECIIPVPVIYHFIQHVFANSIAFDLTLPPFRNFRPLKHIKYLLKKREQYRNPPKEIHPSPTEPDSKVNFQKAKNIKSMWCSSGNRKITHARAHTQHTHTHTHTHILEQNPSQTSYLILTKISSWILFVKLTAKLWQWQNTRAPASGATPLKKKSILLVCRSEYSIFKLAL